MQKKLRIICYIHFLKISYGKPFFLMKFDVENELFYRALEIIQDEEYLDDVDFDEIKRQKRQSPDQNEDKINSETIEAFKKALNLHEIVEMQKIQVNLCQKLFFLQKMGRTCCVQKFF
jgi:hypothetical protein